MFTSREVKITMYLSPCHCSIQDRERICCKFCRILGISESLSPKYFAQISNIAEEENPGIWFLFRLAMYYYYYCSKFILFFNIFGQPHFCAHPHALMHERAPLFLQYELLFEVHFHINFKSAEKVYARFLPCTKKLI